MSSKRWTNPDPPPLSFAAPTRYQRFTATIGAVWSSDNVTNSPLSKWKVSTGIRILVNCPPCKATGTPSASARDFCSSDSRAAFWVTATAMVVTGTNTVPAASPPGTVARFRTDILRRHRWTATDRIHCRGSATGARRSALLPRQCGPRDMAARLAATRGAIHRICSFSRRVPGLYVTWRNSHLLDDETGCTRRVRSFTHHVWSGSHSAGLLRPLTRKRNSSGTG